MSAYYSQELRIENAKLKAALRHLIDFYDDHLDQMAKIAREVEYFKVAKRRLLPKLDLRMAEIVKANNAAGRLLGAEDKWPKRSRRKAIAEAQ